jgi:F0F1-type ATP synthase membrane subunit b/b'
MILIIFFIVGWFLVKFTPIPTHKTYSEIENDIKNENRN